MSLIAERRTQANALDVLISTTEDSAKCTQSVADCLRSLQSAQREYDLEQNLLNPSTKEAFSQLRTTRSRISLLESRLPKNRTEWITRTALSALGGVFCAGLAAFSAYGLTNIINGNLFLSLKRPTHGALINLDIITPLLFLMITSFIAPPLAIGIGTGITGLAICIYKVAKPVFEQYQLHKLRTQEEKLKHLISTQPADMQTVITKCKQAERRCLDTRTDLRRLELAKQEAKEREQLALFRVNALSRIA